MIFTQFKLIAIGVAAAAAIGAFTWFYLQGKHEAREECLAEQAEVMQLWQDKLETAQEENLELAKNLAVYITKLDEMKAARTKRIIKYVENDPDSDTVVFDADGLQLLNEAQQGGSTSSK